MNSTSTSGVPLIRRGTGARALLADVLKDVATEPDVRDTTREPGSSPGGRRVELRWERGLSPGRRPLRGILAAGLGALRRSAPSGCALLLAWEEHSLVGAAVSTGPRGEAIWLRSEDRAGEGGIADALRDHRDVTACCFAVGAAIRQRAVTARFFPEVRRVVDQIAAAWTSPIELQAEARRRLALQLVCRLMFVRFVEHKGWFGGNERFLAGLLLASGATGLYRGFLRPLFLEVLNRPVSERAVPELFGVVPFLNGGLFAPSRDEAEHEALDLPDAVVRAGYERLFVRWRFVASAASEGGDAIDPAMLGHVFERLMDADERTRTGTWYTPPELVAPMVGESIRRLLRSRVGIDVDSAPDVAAATALYQALDNIRVLDPACGSGAFLLGALEEIAALRLELAARMGRVECPAAARRAVLARNLYGIDISATAVGLAELRLWLALAAAMPHGPGEHIVPLPNLGHHIRHGDALISPWQAAWSAGISVGSETAAAMRHVGQALAAASGAAKGTLEGSLRALEREAAEQLRAATLRRLGQQIEALEMPRHDLFGDPIPLRSAELRQLDSLRRQRDGLLGEATRSDEAGHGVAFDARLHFADVLADGGFDLVIGNPPWVRLSEVAPERRTLLRTHYRWMAESGTGRAFGAQPDLAVAFVERAAGLTRSGGLVSMLIPSKLFTAGFAGAMRRDLLEKHDLIEVSEESGRSRSFGADVYPARLVFRAWCRPGGIVRVRPDAGEPVEVASTELPAGVGSGDAWSLREAGCSRELRRWREGAPALGERVAPRLGVKTGANKVFLDPEGDIGPLIPAVRGRDLRAFGPVDGTSLLFAYDQKTAAIHTSVEPATAAWLERHEAVLSARRDADPRLPPWQVFRVRPDALGHRVAWRDLSPQLEACALRPVWEGGPIALNSVYTVSVPSREHALRLAAWLNTGVVRRLATAGADAALGGYRRYYASQVERVPVPGFVWEGGGATGARLLHLADRLARGVGGPDALAALEELARAWATGAAVAP